MVSLEQLLRMKLETNICFSELGISYMGLRFSLDIFRNLYHIELRGDSSNVRLFVDGVDQNISVKKQCKFILKLYRSINFRSVPSITECIHTFQT